MGAFKLFSDGEPPFNQNNPDPKNFKITKIREFDKSLVLQVNYPDATNYEGDKILVFRGIGLSRIAMQKELDPHFTDGKFSPFARFEPTIKGWHWACSLAKALSENDLKKEGD